jgi:hypothetical protein
VGIVDDGMFVSWSAARTMDWDTLSDIDIDDMYN